MSKLSFHLLDSGIGVLVGGGIMLGTIMAWTGTTDLNAIKSAVDTYVNQAETDVEQMASAYVVEIGKANAEIEDYQRALEKANDNINQLIVAYQEQQTDMNTMLTMEEAQQLIAEANKEIEKANQEVQQARTYVEEKTSATDLDLLFEQQTSGAEVQLGGSKEVTSIDSVIEQAE